MRFGNLGRLAAVALLSASGFVAAGDIRSQDWSWNIDDPEWLYAGTQNTAENMLAQFCDPTDGNCTYAVAFGLSCEEGSRYPALVNTDQGSHSLNLVCGKKLDDENLMYIEDFGKIDHLVRGATRIGFVMPLKGDEFKAVRFSLKGAVNALDLMRKAATKLHALQSRKSGVKPAVERL